ncbi:MAG: hypothetical protein R3B72_35840 [Polyangiaceae bacterium]
MAGWIVTIVAAVPTLLGAFVVYIRNGIHAEAFTKHAARLLDAGRGDRFEKLLVASRPVPLAVLLGAIWQERQAPEGMPSTIARGGYRDAVPLATYVERLAPVVAAHLERARARLSRPLWLTLAGAVPFPTLVTLLGPPSPSGPWIMAGFLALLSALTFVAVRKQRKDVAMTVEELVPRFERFARESG